MLEGPVRKPLHEEGGERVTKRRRTLKSGRILIGVQHSISECVIRDMSDSGMRLAVGADQHVPVEFMLYVPSDQVCYRLRRVRRTDTELGCEILGTVEKPSWCRV